ncbi:Glutathione dehydrogenase (ascorbate) [Handroanthus impetiginosus]|uniref:Glutathione dehydrogenase (Ascorbate) n=1 Tax=Handroanthus impetiginosus TaxID=429701 RepID=A0A2G9GQ04_9LAMI|nr:Glutathione dehydrogenase (ascorbate) [Handroanthus impetiginosus]
MIMVFAEEAMARTCESPSFTFRGPCIIDHNCKAVCVTEGFTDGDCEGFRRRCFCRKPC